MTEHKSQTITVNIHGPQVESIHRQEDTGTIVLELSNNGALHGTVDVFMSDKELRTLITALQQFEASERASVIAAWVS
jgi:hypothetical protein